VKERGGGKAVDEPRGEKEIADTVSKKKERNDVKSGNDQKEKTVTWGEK